MRFFTATTIAALSALSLVSASPYNVEARDLAERQVLELTVGPVNLDVQALVGPETCPPIDEDGITARAFAVVSLGEAVNAVVNVAGLAEITGTVTATADVCVCARVGLDVGLIDLPVDIQAQALVGLRAAADLTLDTNLITFLDNVVAADVDLTPTNRVDCICDAANQFPTCVDGVCGCGTCPAGQIYNAAIGVCVPTPSALTRRRALGFGRESHLRQAKRADIVDRLRNYA